jgi:hypothetical protein
MQQGGGIAHPPPDAASLPFLPSQASRLQGVGHGGGRRQLQAVLLHFARRGRMAYPHLQLRRGGATTSDGECSAIGFGALDEGIHHGIGDAVEHRPDQRRQRRRVKAVIQLQLDLAGALAAVAYGVKAPAPFQPRERPLTSRMPRCGLLRVLRVTKDFAVR